LFGARCGTAATSAAVAGRDPDNPLALMVVNALLVIEGRLVLG
jgi:hypothetical protein